MMRLMKTRALESNVITRATVARASVADATDAMVVLQTEAPVRQKKRILVADNQMHERSRMAQADNRPVEGRLRIDVLTDSIIRVRYAEGQDVPENETPMVVGEFDGPTVCEMAVGPDSVVVTTVSYKIDVVLDPMEIRIETADGEPVTTVGGAEKNFFNNMDAYNTGLCRINGDDCVLAVECFKLDSHEAVYGFGEQFIRLNKVGQTIDLDMIDALGVTTPRSYKNVPFFMTTRGYGVFFNHSSRMTAWIGSMSACDIQIAAEDDFLDYYVILGNLQQVLAQYTDITGKGVVPPKWTFGYWQSKISYESADETLEIAKRLRREKIPCDVIHLDTHWFEKDWYCNLEFDKERFPDPTKYMAELSQMGFKVSLWQLPYIPEGSRLFEELRDVDGFVKTKGGEIYDVGVCFTEGFDGVVGCVDYTNPAAVRIHMKWIRKLLAMGARVVKVDFGEAAPAAGVYADNIAAHRMHNLYPLLYNRAFFEATRDETGEGVIWARSAWAGSQRYPLHWGGDSSAHWSNIIPQVEGGLSLGLSGFQFWSQDIGGFLGKADDTMIVRWMQLGMFLSHSRIHGEGDRELYKFSPTVQRVCRQYIRLRYRLIPYIYGSAHRCVETSLPMARALVVEFQDDPNVWNIGDEYLLGSSLLVAPVTNPRGCRSVYFPHGVWTDWWTGERIEGGQWRTIEVALETMPLYIREGGIIPLGPVMNYVDERPVNRIALRIAPFETDGLSQFSVPVNDEWVPVVYVAAGGEHSVQIGASNVEFSIELVGGQECSEDVHISRFDPGLAPSPL